MTWLVWRQYRAQAAIAAAVLAAFGAVLLVTGLQMASQWHSLLATCSGSAAGTCGGTPLGSALGHDLAVLSLAVPAVLGILWGAPLVAHELESRTSDFTWAQSITRTRWLTVKAGWLLLAAAVWGGAVAALVTWWSGPRNAMYQDAFQPSTFDMQGIVPVGYAVFATALGIAAGTMLRRTLPAIAVVLGGFIGMRLLTSQYIRQHYIAAVTAYYNPAGSYTPSGSAWVLGSGVVTRSGQVISAALARAEVDGVPVSALPASCQRLLSVGRPPSAAQMHAVVSCANAHGFRAFVTYQPASRYWAFQGIETGIFLALAAALIAATFVIISRRDA